MTLHARPRLADFEARLEQAFTATTPEGASAGEWMLAGCEALPVPDLPQLAGQDCYSLTFRCEAGLVQGLYQLVAADGFVVAFFAVPVAAGRMHVTVN
ncbi:hypothetical protein OKA04_16270 [Luteolibacter flavescens]|uniref:DUF6916 domain-containing protein n=1 Tax=Luteolibacter flavescens TaxID=1859460 RepID=A0ABT3FSV8_9BACT|nr:hypothetical protein [Luteolibacter flavescens]MCW1886294.1 hypothetical protein [Luteolibacter flavescens]